MAAVIEAGRKGPAGTAPGTASKGGWEQRGREPSPKTSGERTSDRRCDIRNGRRSLRRIGRNGLARTKDKCRVPAITFCPRGALCSAGRSASLRQPLQWRALQPDDSQRPCSTPGNVGVTKKGGRPGGRPPFRKG